jgi:ATP-dependent DNA ligase
MRINRWQELVIGGYIPAAETFDAILVGYYDKDFLYAAKVRNGFVPATRERLFERFRALERTTCPFRTYLKPKGDDGVRGLSAADYDRVPLAGAAPSRRY